MTNSEAREVLESPFAIQVTLGVFEPLGRNLYSNSAAVLSELVANAWDADATRVDITFSDGSVIVHDNGLGMSIDDLNNKFLTIGYQKRTKDGLVSKRWGRPYMGRKGIGKLSVFSLADEVSVISCKGGEVNGFTISAEALSTHAAAGTEYKPPTYAGPFPSFGSSGTRVELSSLRGSRVDLTAGALRKRLARRFDVLSPTPDSEGGFCIYIDGKPLTFADRVDLSKVQFLWTVGDHGLPQELVSNKTEVFHIDDNALDGHPEWKINGWFGTVAKPSMLVEDDEAGDLKNVIIKARNRPIQDGILDKLNFNRIFTSYVTGEIAADFLDSDEAGQPDISTSDRQRLIEDDPRVVGLVKKVRSLLTEAADEWSEARKKTALVRAKESEPVVLEWLDGLDDWQQEAASKLITSIASLPLEDKKDTTLERRQRAALYKAGIVAFQAVSLQENADQLSALADSDISTLLPFLVRQEHLEAALYFDIVESRLAAVTALQAHLDDDALEKVLQDHLFRNLWLLDSGWDRAQDGPDPAMEQKLQAMATELGAEHNELDTSKKDQRIDIRYRMAGGLHVIVELKRAGLRPRLDALFDQGQRYYDYLYEALKNINPDATPDIRVVFVTGKDPQVNAPRGTTDRHFLEQRLSPIHASTRTYAQLVGNARAQYGAYLQKQGEFQPLKQILDRIGTAV